EINRYKTVILIIAALVAFCSSAQNRSVPDSIAICVPGEPDSIIEDAPVSDPASRLMSVEEIAEATDSILFRYDREWKELSMQGKLSFTGLPMRVNVKVYMKRGESVILSARAPIFGEVARVEMCPDSIVFINKHTRCYNTQSFAGLTSDPQKYICDLQDILLGQVAFPGNGRLTQDIAQLSQWIAMPGDNALIHPSDPLQIKGMEYGFVMDSVCWQLRSFVMMLKKSGVVVATNYLYGDEDWTLGIEISINNKKMNGEVALSYPDYAPSPLYFTEIGNKYRRVEIKDLMKF
ncbi:MAG: DUF4292 domain-containing protein, partial [Muribaculaceae bacterium]|nr:DUF4292 domain-containing protein [Muribaculaceae bacterium]